MKLVIGSAQMGMPYGLFNKKKIRSSEIVKISKLAKKSKINFIDTAIGYGDSEKIIGKIPSTWYVSSWSVDASNQKSKRAD